MPVMIKINKFRNQIKFSSFVIITIQLFVMSLALERCQSINVADRSTSNPLKTTTTNGYHSAQAFKEADEVS